MAKGKFPSVSHCRAVHVLVPPPLIRPLLPVTTMNKPRAFPPPSHWTKGPRILGTPLIEPWHHEKLGRKCHGGGQHSRSLPLLSITVAHGAWLYVPRETKESWWRRTEPQPGTPRSAKPHPPPWNLAPVLSHLSVTRRAVIRLTRQRQAGNARMHLRWPVPTTRMRTAISAVSCRARQLICSWLTRLGGRKQSPRFVSWLRRGWASCQRGNQRRVWLCTAERGPP